MVSPLIVATTCLGGSTKVVMYPHNGSAKINTRTTAPMARAIRWRWRSICHRGTLRRPRVGVARLCSLTGTLLAMPSPVRTPSTYPALPVYAAERPATGPVGVHVLAPCREDVGAWHRCHSFAVARFWRVQTGTDAAGSRPYSQSSLPCPHRRSTPSAWERNAAAHLESLALSLDHDASS